MPPAKIILVDTNCVLRVYLSPTLPLMGAVFGGYRLLSLPSLIKEITRSPELQRRYPAVARSPRDVELKGAGLRLSSASKTRIASARAELKPYAKAFLTAYCRKQRTEVLRQLSDVDLDLLCTAAVVGCSIATDEWPLRLVVEDLRKDDGDFTGDLYTSLDLLNLFEINGQLTASQRQETVADWIHPSNNEKLHRGWEADYWRLFGEQPPKRDGS